MYCETSKEVFVQQGRLKVDHDQHGNKIYIPSEQFEKYIKRKKEIEKDIERRKEIEDEKRIPYQSCPNCDLLSYEMLELNSNLLSVQEENKRMVDYAIKAKNEMVSLELQVELLKSKLENEIKEIDSKNLVSEDSKNLEKPEKENLENQKNSKNLVSEDSKNLEKPEKEKFKKTKPEKNLTMKPAKKIWK